MNTQRPQPFRIVQASRVRHTAPVLLRIIMARSRAEAIAIYCRSTGGRNHGA